MLKRPLSLIAASAAFLSLWWQSLPACAIDTIELDKLTGWKELRHDQSIAGKRDAKYFEFKLVDGTRVHLIAVDMRSGKWILKPILNTSTLPTSDTTAQNGGDAGVNGGYFNLSDGESASFVVLGAKEACDPHHNKTLVANPKLKPFLKEVHNRTEFRVLRNDKGKWSIDIAQHYQPPAAGEHVIDSLQAGPQLLPEMNARDEAFIRINPDGTETDAIGCNKRAARTALGITADGTVLIVAVEGKRQSEFSEGLNLNELATLMRNLGCAKAMNFDGGTSTTMVVNLSNRELPGSSEEATDKEEQKIAQLVQDGKDGKLPFPGESKTESASDIKRERREELRVLEMVCGRQPETRIKSALILVRQK